MARARGTDALDRRIEKLYNTAAAGKCIDIMRIPGLFTGARKLALDEHATDDMLIIWIRAYVDEIAAVKV